MIVTRTMSEVAAAYDNTVQQFADDSRDATRELRSFNNKVKRALIDETSNFLRPTKVLDLCCGRGGDMGKILKHQSVRVYHGIDISPISIREAHARSATHNRHGASVHLDVMDVSNGFASPHGSFELINQQFSLHYMWHPTTMNNFCRMLSAHLKEGGCWIGTVPNKTKIQQVLDGALQLPDICRITPVNENTYRFYLEGCVADVEEHFVEFDEIALRQHGLQVRMCCPMVDYGDMRGLRFRTHSQWTVASLYDVFIIQKVAR